MSKRTFKAIILYAEGVDKNNETDFENLSLKDYVEVDVDVDHNAYTGDKKVVCFCYIFIKDYFICLNLILI